MCNTFCGDTLASVYSKRSGEGGYIDPLSIFQGVSRWWQRWGLATFVDDVILQLRRPRSALRLSQAVTHWLSKRGGKSPRINKGLRPQAYSVCWLSTAFRTVWLHYPLSLLPCTGLNGWKVMYGAENKKERKKNPRKIMSVQSAEYPHKLVKSKCFFHPSRGNSI